MQKLVLTSSLSIVQIIQTKSKIDWWLIIFMNINYLLFYDLKYKSKYIYLE